MITNKIYCGDALSRLKEMPAESINCCISSPPYWALRDYGTATWEGGKSDCDHLGPPKPTQAGFNERYTGRPPQKTDKQGELRIPYKDFCGKCGAKRIDLQLGLEKTFEEYIDKLCTIYDEVKRVLTKDGTCWVNLGDTYGTHTQKQCGQPAVGIDINSPANRLFLQKRPDVGLEKSLCLIPQRFAIEMLNRGWLLRNVIAWHKPNPMPSSAKDRFTVDFEYVYFFVKSKKYFFEPIYEQGIGITSGVSNETKEAAINYFKTKPSYNEFRKWYDNNVVHKNKFAGTNNRKGMGEGNSLPIYYKIWSNPLGRNKRTVWTIPTQAYPDAHFATFPEKLVEPMILSGCPKEVCSKCGQGRRKVYEPTMQINRTETYGGKQKGQGKQFPHKRIQMLVKAGREAGLPHDNTVVPKKFKGYTDCGCGAEFRLGVTLDPFWGRARLARSLPRTDATGLALNSNRSIPKWLNAA